MTIQINYVLVSIDSDRNTRIQVFTDYDEAYKTMVAEYKATLTALEIDEDEAGDETFIEKNSAQISNPYDDTIGWIIEKTFVQTPEIAAVCRQYDEMISEALIGSSFHKIQRSAGFCCPCAEANINACYDNDKGILYFAVCHMAFDAQKEFIPFETYKWCLDHGIIEVSGLEEASCVLAGIDATASFGNK